MSKYTTELRFICEEKAGLANSVGENDVAYVINNSVDKIFNFDYPIFNESYRNVLNKKIIGHFFFSEIGFETYGLWHNRLQVKMNEIMPYYNKLYLSEEIVHDPLRNYDITKIHNGEFETARLLDRTGKDTEKRTGADTDVYSGTETESHTGTDSRAIDTLNSNGDKWTLFSDTPQGGLDGIENASDDIKANAYLTNATREITSFTDGKTDELTHGEIIEIEHDKEIAHQRNTQTEFIKGTQDDETKNGTDAFTEHEIGYRDIDPNKMLKEYRNNLLNIDMMIIDELEELFFQLW